MANAHPAPPCRFARQLRHCRAIEERISVELLATRLINFGYPSYRFSQQSQGSADDHAWLVTCLTQLEVAMLADPWPLENDPTHFIEALSACLPRAGLAADRLTFAFLDDLLERHGLKPFFSGPP